MLRKRIAAMLLGTVLAAGTPAALARAGADFTSTDPALHTVRSYGTTCLTGAKVEEGRTAEGLLSVLRPSEGTRVEIPARTAEMSEARAEYIATGQRAHVCDAATGERLESLVLVVTGDVLGTGENNIAQLTAMARNLTGAQLLEGPYRMAADRNGNGLLEIADLALQAKVLTGDIQAPQTPVPPASEDQTRSDETLELVNAIRAQAGRPALCASSSLNQAAMVRAREMADMGEIGHTRPDGSSCFTVFEANTWKGENCVALADVPQEVARKAVELWKNSPGHYANMVSENFICMGSAYVLGDDGRWYGCQLFSGSQVIDRVDTQRYPGERL